MHRGLQFNTGAKIDAKIMGALARIRQRTGTMTTEQARELDEILLTLWQLTDKELSQRVMALDNSTAPSITSSPPGHG